MAEFWNDPDTLPENGTIVVVKTTSGVENLVVILEDACNIPGAEKQEIEGWRAYDPAEWE